jgi:hypothetical protein
LAMVLSTINSSLTTRGVFLHASIKIDVYKLSPRNVFNEQHVGKDIESTGAVEDASSIVQGNVRG